MPQFRVSFFETVDVEADDEALAVEIATDMLFLNGPDTSDVEVELIDE